MGADIIQIGLAVDSKQVDKGTKSLDKLAKQGKKTESATGKMSQGFKALGGVIAAIGFASLINSMIKTAASFESMSISLEVVTGSAEKATQAMEGITAFAKKTPFQVSEITDAFIKLKALGITPTEASLTSFGNTSSAMGKSLNQMIEAVADASTFEFERLKEFGIKAKQQADSVIFTFQGVATEVGKTSKEITEFLESIGREKFGGAMEKQMDTMNGKLSNLGDSFDMFAVKLLQDNTGGKGILDLAITATNFLTDGLTTVRIGIVETIGFFDKMWETVKLGAEVSKLAITGIFSPEETAKRIEVLRVESEAAINGVNAAVDAYIEGEERKKEAGLGAEGIDVAGAEAASQQAVLDIKREFDDADIERLQEKYATEAELLTLKYEQENAILAEKLAVDASFQSEYNRLTLLSHDERIRDEVVLEKKAQKSKLALKLSEARMAAGIADKAAVLMNSKNKEMFEIGKAAATASALINTYEGATKALSQGGFWGIFMAAAVVAAGIAQVSNIQSQQFGGGSAGGAAPSMPSISTTEGVPDSSGISDVSAIEEPQTQITLNIDPDALLTGQVLINTLEELGDNGMLNGVLAT